MNTSESSKSGASSSQSLDLNRSAPLPPAGLPDPRVLSQIANEMFRAISAEPHAGALDHSLTQGFTPDPNSPDLSNADGLSEAALRSIPATLNTAGAARSAENLAPPVAAAPPSAQSIALPGIPGGFSLQSLSQSEAPFGFLQEARGIYASPPAVPVHAVPTPTSAATASPTQLPTGQTELSSLVNSLSGDELPSLPATPRELPAPQVPGAPAIGDRAGAPAFLQETNPLDPIGFVPSLAPAADLAAASNSVGVSSVPFDVNAVRRDFPILQERINGRQLIWLDNAATTQKPQSVIDRLAYFYAHENSNVHRAAHSLAARSTDAFEAARQKVQRFLNAASPQEIIFVRGATEAINLVAQSWGRRNIQKDDEIVISHLEHHANIVPWQMLCAEKGARLRVAPVDDTGQIILEEYERLFNSHTKLAAFTQVSNALGTVTPVQQMVEIAHRHGALALVDGAQAVSHMAVDVQEYDCDFYVFSGHKVFAPTGIGVLFGKQSVLANTPPWQGGGNMISDVTFEKTLYQPPPGRFEAGTGNIADAVGLGAAIDYVQRVGMSNISRQEHDLLVHATDALRKIPGLRLIGTAKEKAGVLSFVLDGFRTEDVGAYLNEYGIAVRSGHHCAQPILRRFGVESTVRPSLAFYNTCDEIDALIAAIWNLKGGRAPGLL